MYGEAFSPFGTGIRGENKSTDGSGHPYGVAGFVYSPSGTAVAGFSGADTRGTGMLGEANGAGSRGVVGRITAATGANYGVVGEDFSTNGTGVRGYATSRTGATTGVEGEVFSPNGVAIRGIGRNGGRGGRFSGRVDVDGRLVVDGNVGIGTETPAARLHVVGGFIATGTKLFVQPHPTRPTKEIIYVSLEGPEAGTYIRGTAKLRKGKAVISLPEHFGLVTNAQGLTVQLTPIGAWLQLYVVRLTSQQIIVADAQGRSGTFHYHVHGVRKGYERHRVIRDRMPQPAAMRTTGR